MALDLPVGQKVELTLSITDAAGNPGALVDTVNSPVPQWVSSDPAIVSLDIAADGRSAYATALRSGTVTVTVTADADLTAALTTITATLTVNALAGPATGLTIVAGTPGPA